MLYLDEHRLNWAQATSEDKDGDEAITHMGSNETVLEADDTATLT